MYLTPMSSYKIKILKISYVERRMSRRQRQILQQGTTIRFAHIGSHSVHKSIHSLVLLFCQFFRSRKRPRSRHPFLVSNALPLMHRH